MPAAKPLILLAPSEDKAPGGLLARLAENAAQRWVREGLMDLVRTGTPLAQKRAFAVKELALNRARSEALALKGKMPLLPALERYTGVAFRALDPLGLPRDRWEQIFILSGLRGLVARWILEHQEGEPKQVLKGRLPDCTWEGAVENDRGGLALTLRMDS